MQNWNLLEGGLLIQLSKTQLPLQLEIQKKKKLSKFQNLDLFSTFKDNPSCDKLTSENLKSDLKNTLHFEKISTSKIRELWKTMPLCHLKLISFAVQTPTVSKKSNSLIKYLSFSGLSDAF